METYPVRGEPELSARLDLELSEETHRQLMVLSQASEQSIEEIAQELLEAFVAAAATNDQAKPCNP